MKTRYFALVFGVVYLIVGILGFVPSLIPLPPEAPPLAIDASYGYLFGLFPVNIIENIVHMAIGIWGLTAWRDWQTARGFSRSNAVIFGILAVLGFIPGLNTVFGLVPLHSHNIWLHAVTAIIAAYFGWAAVSRTSERETTVLR